MELSEDGNTYTIKSLTNQASVVNLSVTRTAPAFHVGKDGNSTFGTDPKAPWGTMRHAFWPRATSSGTITTKDGAIDFKGKAAFIHCLQGMKPHHAAAKWKFCNFQSENYSAIAMEFITPPSYGSTAVTVGGITKGNEIVWAGSTCSTAWSKVKDDSEVGWQPPEAVKFEWNGKTKDGKNVTGLIEGPLDEHYDRVDIMAEVPGFIKQIVAGAAGTKPYIYQVSIIPILRNDSTNRRTVPEDQHFIEGQNRRRGGCRGRNPLRRGDLHIRVKERMQDSSGVHIMHV